MVGKRDRHGSPDPPEASAASGTKKRREGRIRRHLRTAGEVRRDPKQAYPLLRSAFVDTWRSRGGGFYGLGYVITFVYLELDLLLGDVLESDNVGDFALGQFLEYLLRISLLSFVNAFQALIWPVFILEHLGWAGIILLAAGYLGFEHALKPLVEQYVPELRAPASRNPDQ